MPDPSDAPLDDGVAHGGRRRASRTRKWDRPAPPRDWRFWVGGAGRVLLTTGILMFGFVAYQLWGTGLETARAQDSLENEFEDLLAANPTSTAVTTVPTTVPATVPTTAPASEPTTAPSTAPATTPPTTEPPPPVQDLPPIAEGDPVARIEIPAIGVDKIVVAGVGVDDLRKGPGHFPETPLPGQLGNAALAGHRTTYGQPFRNVDDLVPGDEIVVTTVAGRFVYDVTGAQIVDPSDTEVLLTTDPDVAALTLISCDPPFTARNRIVVSATLDVAASDRPGAANPYGFDEPAAVLPPETVPATASTTGTTAAPDTTATAATAPATTAPTETTVGAAPVTTVVPGGPGAGAGGVTERSEDAFAKGWFHDDGAFAQVALWGVALTAIAVGAWMLSRRTRHDLVGLAAGLVPFAIALFFFFQNVNRLLPPSL